MPTQYIVQSGDTLRSIAAKVFGDATLWYVIAEENGLANPDEVLTAGTQLRIPNEVVSLSNSASSFKPFDVSAALGDTTPTQPLPPAPKKKGCGVVGQIIVIVVAIVVGIVSYGAGTGWAASLGTAIGGTGATGAAIGVGIAAAAGSVVSQGVAIGIGQQDSFSWTGVAAAALAGGLGAGVSVAGSSLGSQVANAAINSTINQGVNIALGLQDSFNWAAVAASAVAAPIANYVGQQVGIAAGRAFNSNAVGEFAGRFTGGLVNQIAYASFTGGKINYAQLGADAFGNALGNSIVDKLGPQATTSTASKRNGSNALTSDDVLEEIQITARRLDVNPESDVINPGFNLTPDQQRNAAGNQPDPVAVMELQQALAREEAERFGGSNRVGYGPGGNYSQDGALYIEITRGANDLSPSSDGSFGVFNEAQASMRDYWTGAQDGADSFLGYASDGIMRSLGDVGYGIAETAVAMYRDPGGTLRGVGQAAVNFGPESFNALTNLSKTSLNGLTMLAEATIAPQSAFASFRESDPYNIELLAPYSNRAAAGGAFLANVGLGVGLAKYGNAALQSPVYLDLQQGAVAYSGLPIGMRSPLASASEAGALTGIPRAIATPYGDALQSSSLEALAARAQVEQGTTLYRLGTLGRSEAVEAQFWSLENPLNSGYAARYGLPPANVANANFIETAVLKPGTPFVTRAAPAIGANPGGGIEVVVPTNGVQMTLFSTK